MENRLTTAIGLNDRDSVIRPSGMLEVLSFHNRSFSPNLMGQISPVPMLLFQGQIQAPLALTPDTAKDLTLTCTFFLLKVKNNLVQAVTAKATK